MFNSVKQAYYLAGASAIVRELLSRFQTTGFFKIDPKEMSSKLVAQIFTQGENLFNGKNGPRPHNLSIAALALAQGMNNYNNFSDEYAACRFSIGIVLMDLEANQGNYALTDKDRTFFELARRAYFDHDDLTPSPWDCGRANEPKQAADLEARKQDIDERLGKFRR